MTKQFEEAKEKLDAELQAVYNRSENTRKREKIHDLELLRQEILKKEKAYDDAVKDEDFDAAVNIQIELENMRKKEDIMNNLIQKMKTDVPDYPYENIVDIIRKISVYSNKATLELFKKYRQQLMEAEKTYEELEKVRRGFYYYASDLKRLTSKRISDDLSPNVYGASSLSEYIYKADEMIEIYAKK